MNYRFIFITPYFTTAVWHCQYFFLTDSSKYCFIFFLPYKIIPMGRSHSPATMTGATFQRLGRQRPCK